MNIYTKLSLALTGFVLAGASAQAAFNYQVSGIQKELVGTTKSVAGGGALSNFSALTAVNGFAVFDMVSVDDAHGGAKTDFADLKITYLSDNYGAGNQVMIARTVNSQGLKDTGTISVLMKGSGTGGGTISLKFEWYTPGSFVGGIQQGGASLISTKVNYTTFDIDYEQVVSVKKSEIASYTTNGAASKIKVTDDGTNIAFKDNNAISTFSNPNTAAQFTTIGGTAAHTISMGKQKNRDYALFMFEFRDPSDVLTFNDPLIVAIPEPSTTGVMLGAAALGLFFVKRRRKA